MPSYMVDSVNQPMTATGIVDPIQEWDETPEGGRRPSERQARDEATGMPLWAVEVLYPQTSFGRESTVCARVTVGSVDRPTPGRYTPIGFVGLRVELRVNKAGGFTEYWSAEGLMPTHRSTKATGSASPASATSSTSPSAA